jgi:hypothetical protein
MAKHRLTSSFFTLVRERALHRRPPPTLVSLLYASYQAEDKGLSAVLFGSVGHLQAQVRLGVLDAPQYHDDCCATFSCHVGDAAAARSSIIGTSYQLYISSRLS